MVLGSTQPLTETSTRNISWGKGGRCLRVTTLPTPCADCLEIWVPQPPGTLRACQGLSKPVMELLYLTHFCWGHAVMQWLRHCATNRKVTGQCVEIIIDVGMNIIIFRDVTPCQVTTASHHRQQSNL
jgi:hypothetical protein